MDMTEKALEIAKLLEYGKGRDIVVLDISELCSWTDYFIIGTINSSSHWQGLYSDIYNYAKTNGLTIKENLKKSPNGSDWNLVDLGQIVVHLMSHTAREFYDLEKLWHDGKKIFASNDTMCN